MTFDGWEQVPDGKMPASELSLQDDIGFKYSGDLDPSPPYEETLRSTDTDEGPSILRIIGATWGGVNITAEIQGLVTIDASGKFETVNLNMHTIHTSLLPDPAVGVIKTLTILYEYSGGNCGMRLLNATQFAPQITIQITPTAHLDENKSIPDLFISVKDTAWRNEGQIEIIALLYGTSRIETPSVLEEFARFFEGRRGQIRTTSSFFRRDPWFGVRKSWTVYFRLLSSANPRVRCVTGMEDGALEVPWTRD